MEAAQSASSSGSCLCPQSVHSDKSEKDARRARLLQALVCARRADIETRVKNHSDEMIFHSQGLRLHDLRCTHLKPGQ